MNNTNRALNRLLLVVLGIVLLALGAAAILVGSVPAVRDGWDQTAPDVFATVTGWLQATPLAAAGSSWLLVAVVAVLAIAIVLLVLFIVRQGQGRTGTAVRDTRQSTGTTVLRSSFAEQLVSEALSDRPELLSAHTSTWNVRGTPVLKVAVTLQRGVSPRVVGTMVDELLDSLDQVVGQETPAVVSLGGGFRARSTRATTLK